MLRDRVKSLHDFTSYIQSCSEKDIRWGLGGEAPRDAGRSGVVALGASYFVVVAMGHGFAPGEKGSPLKGVARPSFAPSTPKWFEP